MKRFGLKAIAAALALTMVASLGVPAAAKAEDKVLLTDAPKAGSVLEITQSMVDSEGELVLSGETFDKVVIPNDVEVRRLYVDGGEIGELIIESGNNPEVQIWDTQIGNVTVVPSELIDLNASLVEYLEVMLASEDPSAFDVSGFVNQIQGKNEVLSTEAPKIVLKGADMEGSTQKIEKMNLNANAKLDCTEGKMPVALNVNLEGGKQNMNVTVKGFVGDMSLNQTSDADEAYGLMNVKLEESVVGTVAVAAAGNASVMLHSADSVAETIKYTSNGETTLSKSFSVDMLASNLVTTEEASNADIRLVSSVDNVEVNGKNVELILGSHAEVQTATVAGSDNTVSGLGRMNECKIPDGYTATVLVMGANVDGKNLYVPTMSLPEVEVPDEEPEAVNISVDFEDGTRGAFNSQCGGPTFTVEDGVLKVTNRANNYDGPAIDLGKYNPKGKTLQMSFKAKNDSASACKINATINSKDSATPYLGVAANDSVQPGEWVTISGSLTVPADGTAFSIYIEAPANCDFSVDDISIIIEGAGGSGSAESVINFASLTIGGYGHTVSVVDGVVKGTINDRNQEIQFVLPSVVDLADYSKIIIEVESDQALDIKLVNPEAELDQWNNKTPFKNEWTGATVASPYVINLDETLRGYKLSQIGFMLNADDAANITIKSMRFE